MPWNNISRIYPQQYECGHCDCVIASEYGYNYTSVSKEDIRRSIYICPYCYHPTYFISNILNQVINKFPSSSFGNSVGNLPDVVQKLYDEARRCTSDGSYTAAVMVCRKLLMHIAVEKGAEEKKSFKEYVEYLDKGNYLPANSEHWVDHIRDQGNEANHKIVLKNESDANSLVEFIEMLLKLIYEFPARVSKFKPK